MTTETTEKKPRVRRELSDGELELKVMSNVEKELVKLRTPVARARVAGWVADRARQLDIEHRINKQMALEASIKGQADGEFGA
jgi:hypothetical protein